MKTILKYIFTIAVTFGLICLCMHLLKSCQSENTNLSEKSNSSLKVDSIQQIKTDSLIFANDSLIRRFQIQDSIQKAKIETLSGKYYALRASISKLKTVHIDSSNQSVIVPADQYNASINSGNMCDSLLGYMDIELQIKDSIISVKDIQKKHMADYIVTKEQALQDLIALNEQEKKHLKKSKKLNKNIPAIASISAFVGFIIATILIK